MLARPVSFLAFCLLAAGPLGAAGLTPRLVKDINAGAASSSSSPADFIPLGGIAFFTADDGNTGVEPWRTDGTAGGTYRLADICAGPCTSRPAPVALSDRSYYFSATDGDHFALWVSSGTPATTFKLASTAASYAYPHSQRWVPGLGLLFLAADDGVHGVELWRSDGTPGGTYQVTDLMPGSPGSYPHDMTVFRNRLYFIADDIAGNGQYRSALWTSDGTPQGTRMVIDPAPGSAFPQGFTDLRVAGRFLYFVAPTPSQGVELWKSDGTARGTAPLTDLVPGAGSPVFWDFATFGDRLLFVADDGRSGQELWITDGAPTGTQRLTAFAAAAAFHNGGLDLYLQHNVVGSRFLFSANDGVHGTELWATDGTPSGTVLLKDVCPGPCSGTSYVLTVLGDHLMFIGSDPAQGQEPWISDGTAAGTYRLRDTCRGSCGTSLGLYTSSGSRAFFAQASSHGHQQQLWRTDGTSRGTVQVASVESLQGQAGLDGTLLGNTLVFSAADAEHGLELWRSDGTAQGTYLLKDINRHRAAVSSPDELPAMGTGEELQAPEAP